MRRRSVEVPLGPAKGKNGMGSKRKVCRPLALVAAVAAMVAIAAPSGGGVAVAQSGPTGLGPWTDVTRFGATGNGEQDATQAIRRAIDHTPNGGLVFFPPGKYRVNGEIVIDRPVSLAGTGLGSQIHQSSPDQSLFVFRNVQAVSVRDLYLGSSATAADASLLELVNTHRSRFENITMLGGGYGVHLQGSLLNTFADLRSGVNIGGFFAPTSANSYWVFAERFNGISANANTFLAPTLEGGANGIRLEDEGGEGSLHVYGGTIEGVSGVGLSLHKAGLPSVISGVHFEANGIADIELDQAYATRIEGVFATGKIMLGKTTLNTTIANGLIHAIAIDAEARRTRLENLMVDLGASGGGIEDHATDTQYTGVSGVNPFDWFGTLGIGIQNPNSNPVGLTPDLKLHVDGRIRADAFDTGDILFRADGRPLWRMYEDEHGLQLENVRTGEVSKVFLENDLRPLADRLDALQREVTELRRAVEPAPRQ